MKNVIENGLARDGGLRLTHDWVWRWPSHWVNRCRWVLPSPMSRRWSFGCLIGCLVLILSFFIFLKILKCQLVSGKQKIPPLYHDRIVTVLINKYYLFFIFFNGDHMSYTSYTLHKLHGVDHFFLTPFLDIWYISPFGVDHFSLTPFL